MKFLLSIALTFLSISLLGQELLHTRRAKFIEAYTEAKSLVESGNFYQSEEILNDLLAKERSFDEAIVLLHEISIKRDEPDLAKQIISNYAVELEPHFLNRLNLIQANYDYQLGKYKSADSLMSFVNGRVHQIDTVQVTFLRKSIKFSLDQVERPLDIQFEKLPFPINKFGIQYFPSITRDGQLVYTMRDQLGRGDENLFVSQLENGQWSEPRDISFQINTERNEGTASISADGKTLVFTGCNRPNNIGSCDLYISYFENDDWTSPILLSEEVNSKEWDSQPSLSADGNTLYFVSLRSGGLGKHDIWVSKRKGEGWLPAENLGAAVNTPEDDISPFIYLDGETLIFATKGRIGMGGYDLFKTTKDGEDWAEPLNLGFPINDAFDQVGYCVAADLWAYFSSSDPGGQIFLKRFRVPNSIVQPVELPISALGQVLDASSDNSISAEIWFISNDTLTLEVQKGESFSFDAINFDSIGAKSIGFRNSLLSKAAFLKDSIIRLQPFVPGESLLEKPILFAFDSFEITSEASSRLEKVILLLELHPELQVEVRGYTDSSGETNYNKRLSQKRASAVAEYLLKALPNGRLIRAVGFGEYQPTKELNTHQSFGESRRVDIVVSAVKK